VGLERGSLSLVSTTEGILGRKSSGSGLENRVYGRRGFLHADYVTLLYQQELALTSSTSGGRYVDIAHSRTQTTEFVSF
jgi:hypothetical protein